LELSQWSAHTSTDGAVVYLAQRLLCADKYLWNRLHCQK